jgi:hypothetical protein
MCMRVCQHNSLIGCCQEVGLSGPHLRGLQLAWGCLMCPFALLGSGGIFIAIYPTPDGGCCETFGRICYCSCLTITCRSGYSCCGTGTPNAAISVACPSGSGFYCYDGTKCCPTVSEGAPPLTDTGKINSGWMRVMIW